jgi:hypothetical protein
MKVTATKAGFDGRRLRQPGETFDMPDGSKATWFVPAQKAEDKKPKDDAASAK